MNADSRDSMSYYVRGGLNHLTVVRDVNLPNRPSRLQVYEAVSESFPGVLSGLMDYHNQCVRVHSNGELLVLQGASCAESGELADRELRPWSIKRPVVNLALVEVNLLDGVIQMHNQVVDLTKPKIRT